MIDQAALIVPDAIDDEARIAPFRRELKGRYITALDLETGVFAGVDKPNHMDTMRNRVAPQLRVRSRPFVEQRLWIFAAQ